MEAKVPCTGEAFADRAPNSTLGYYVHLALSVRLPASPKITDVATGSGIFLLDVAKEFPPSTELHGFDIANNWFPRRNDIPPNVHFHIWDAKEAFPVDFHGLFDVVHIRLMLPAMKVEADWRTVMENVLTLLKPGGSIQWTESNFLQTYPAFRGGSAIEQYPEQLNEAVDRWLNLPGFDWRQRSSPPHTGWYALPRIFKKLKLEDVADDVVSSDKLGDVAARRLSTEIWIGAAEASFEMAGWDASTIERTISAARADAEKEGYVRWDIHAVRGSKPKS